MHRRHILTQSLQLFGRMRPVALKAEDAELYHTRSDRTKAIHEGIKQRAVELGHVWLPRVAVQCEIEVERRVGAEVALAQMMK